MWECCLEFLEWRNNIEKEIIAKQKKRKYRKKFTWYYGPSEVEEFINYLNTVKCPEYESTIRGRYEDMKKSKRIEDLPWFLF